MVIQLKHLDNKYVKTIDEAIVEGATCGKSCLSDDGCFYAFMKQDQRSNK